MDIYIVFFNNQYSLIIINTQLKNSLLCLLNAKKNDYNVYNHFKVTNLREELEKEEFYVEYLERLLADVEHHKLANASASSESKASNADSQSAEQSFQSVESNVSESTNPEEEDSAPPVPVREDLSKLQDKCVNELSSTLSSSKRPKSEIPRSPEKIPECRRNSDPDVPSNYVTVIQVTGNSKKDRKEDSVKEEDEKDSEKALEEAEDGDAEASEEEPYYDSVALDPTGEYVYIEAPALGKNGGKVQSRRPPSLPDSPGNQSNYVNIDYFIQ